MKRFLRHVVMVVTLASALAWFGHSGMLGGADESAPPEEADVSVLDKVIVGFEAHDEPLTSVLGRLQRGEPRFVICLEGRIGHDPSASPRMSVSVGPIESATLAQVLDAVTAAAEPGDFYTWYESPIKEGVVHILPRDPNRSPGIGYRLSDTVCVVHILPRDPKERFACLDVIIPHFRVEGVLYYEAFFALFDQPELDGISPGWSIKGPDYAPISLDLVNVTVRDALTHIALATESGMGWGGAGYVQEPPVPRFAFGRLGSVLP